MPSHPDLEGIREAVRASRDEQGLPAKVKDRDALDTVARAIAAREREEDLGLDIA